MAHAANCEFSRDTKEIVAKRSAFRCNNPKCRRSTVGPSRDGKMAYTNVGHIAHIAGRTESSARYDPSMSDEARSSADNAILLCATCHSMVDSDGMTYPVELLLQWKLREERRAAEESSSLDERGFARRVACVAVGRSNQVSIMAAQLARTLRDKFGRSAVCFNANRAGIFEARRDGEALGPYVAWEEIEGIVGEARSACAQSLASRLLDGRFQASGCDFAVCDVGALESDEACAAMAWCDVVVALLSPDERRIARLVEDIGGAAAKMGGNRRIVRIAFPERAGVPSLGGPQLTGEAVNALMELKAMPEMDVEWLAEEVPVCDVALDCRMEAPANWLGEESPNAAAIKAIDERYGAICESLFDLGWDESRKTPLAEYDR